MKKETILFILSEIEKELQNADIDRQLYLIERRGVNLKKLNKMEKKEIKVEYLKMLKLVSESEIFDGTNKTNCYRCEKCGHVVKTIDIDKGTTPFIISCEQCNGSSQSSMYRDMMPNFQPAFEWYRPSLEETLKLTTELDHILNGGLLMRKIEVEDEITININLINAAPELLEALKRVRLQIGMIKHNWNRSEKTFMPLVINAIKKAES